MVGQGGTDKRREHLYAFMVNAGEIARGKLIAGAICTDMVSFEVLEAPQKFFPKLYIGVAFINFIKKCHDA